MKISMNVLFDSHEELTQFTQALSKLPLQANHSCHETNQSATSDAATEKPTKPKEPTTNQKIAAKAEADAKAAADKKDEVSKVETPEKKDESPLTPTYDNMKKAVLLVNKIKGREPTETILKKFEGEKNGKLVVGPHIPEKHFDAIIKECNRILAVA